MFWCGDPANFPDGAGSQRRWPIRLQDRAIAAAIGARNTPPADHLHAASHGRMVDGLAAVAATADGFVAWPWQGFLLAVVDQVAHSSLFVGSRLAQVG